MKNNLVGIWNKKEMVKFCGWKGLRKCKFKSNLLKHNKNYGDPEEQRKVNFVYKICQKLGVFSEERRNREEREREQIS